MHLTLSLDFDSGSWPGPLDGRDAAFGEAWLGPSGFLSLLETQLGLGGPGVPGVVRAAELVPRLLGTEGFWSRSAADNPLATARWVLGWRDRLGMQGWRGEGVSKRLAGMAEVTEGVRPGVPERLWGVMGALGDGWRVGVDVVRLVEARGAWAPLWRRVFAGLGARGVRVVEGGLAAGVEGAGSDLARVRAALGGGGGDGGGGGVEVVADGSLQLLRPYGPRAAAEGVAAWLAGRGELEGVVMVGGDPLLDEASRRFGLPVGGAREEGRDAPSLQVLGLVLGLGWEPPDPRRAAELLALPLGPVPRGVTWRLLRALEEWPAVGSEAWVEALREGLEEIGDGDRRGRVGERVGAIFGAEVRRGQGYPAAEIRRRAGLVRAWAGGMGALEAAESGEGSAGRGGEETGREGAEDPWGAVVAQASLLERLVEASGLAALSAPQLDRFVEAATAGVARGIGARPRGRAEAGIARVGGPGGVAGPARAVVWWGFDAASAPPARRWPLGPRTRRTLAGAGVEVPDPAAEALAEAGRWRRPLLFARDALLLVAPRHDARGEEATPHPLWDEIAGRLGEEAALLEVEEPRPPRLLARTAVTPRPRPRPRRTWQVAAGVVPPRAVESPNGLAKRLGCSFAWAVGYGAGLWPGRATRASSDALLAGKLGHEIVERTLLEGPASPEAAEERAAALFDGLGPRLVATLFLPGSEPERARLRRVCARSARRLAEILAAEGRGVAAVELEVEKPWRGGHAEERLGGRLDLVLEPPAVIDLKLGSARWRADELEAGSHNLALYAELLREPGGPRPPAGFFILSEQRLLALAEHPLEGAELFDGPGLGSAFRAWEGAARAAAGEIAAGRLAAPGCQDDGTLPREGKSGIGGDGLLHLEPPCRFCDLPALCGRAFPEEEA